MNITLITAFCGRHKLVENIITYFLKQTYRGRSMTLLLYNNSRYPQTLDTIKTADNQHIKLINNSLDLVTGKEYTSTGDIFRDALSFVSEDNEVINFMDSDDIFLSNHVEKGVEGMRKAYGNKQLAYKPYYSYFLTGNHPPQLVHNTLEPSIFIDSQYIKEKGFFSSSIDYHQCWEQPLKDGKLLLADKEGEPTFIYNWATNHGTFKISGSGDNGPENLRKHREYETDNGDGILSPTPVRELNKWWK